MDSMVLTGAPYVLYYGKPAELAEEAFCLPAEAAPGFLDRQTGGRQLEDWLRHGSMGS